jgi:hypothetical protein
MTKAEVSKHALWEAAGEVIGKKRKQRSDKGIKKESKAKQGVNDKEDSSDASDNEEEAGPFKKKKITPQQKPATKTKVKRTTMAKMGKKKTISKGKDHSSKSQLPPSKMIITDTEDELEDDVSVTVM